MIILHILIGKVEKCIVYTINIDQKYAEYSNFSKIFSVSYGGRHSKKWSIAAVTLVVVVVRFLCVQQERNIGEILVIIIMFGNRKWGMLPHRIERERERDDTAQTWRFSFGFFCRFRFVLPVAASCNNNWALFVVFVLFLCNCYAKRKHKWTTWMHL